MTEDAFEIEVDWSIHAAAALARCIFLSPNRRCQQGLLAQGHTPRRPEGWIWASQVLRARSQWGCSHIALTLATERYRCQVGRYELKPPFLCPGRPPSIRETHCLGPWPLHDGDDVHTYVDTPHKHSYCRYLGDG